MPPLLATPPLPGRPPLGTIPPWARTPPLLVVPPRAGVPPLDEPPSELAGGHGVKSDGVRTLFRQKPPVVQVWDGSVRLPEQLEQHRLALDKPEVRGLVDDG